MAEKLSKDFEFPARGRGNTKYDWANWLDGSPWKLTPGTDFDKEKAFRAAAYKEARKMGGRLRSAVLEDGSIVVQFIIDPATTSVTP